MIKTKTLAATDSLSEMISLSKSFFKEYEKYQKEYFKIGKIEEKYIRGFFSNTISNKDSKTVIATDGKKVIGYITFSIKKREPFYRIKKVGYVSGIMIDKKYRNKGIGKMLLNKSKKWFEKMKVKYYYLETSVNNALGIKFYEENDMKPLRIQYIGNVK